MITNILVITFLFGGAFFAYKSKRSFGIGDWPAFSVMCQIISLCMTYDIVALPYVIWLKNSLIAENVAVQAFSMTVMTVGPLLLWLVLPLLIAHSKWLRKAPTPEIA